MKKRIFAIIMLLVSLVMVFNLTACGGSNSATPDEASTGEENIEVEDFGVLQIQRTEKVLLKNNDNLPSQVKLYRTATSAYNHPVEIWAENDSLISFSFTVEKGELTRVFDGVFIESNEEIKGVRQDEINSIGDIQTFSMKIYPKTSTDTVVYEMYFDTGIRGDYGRIIYEEAYIAFRVNNASGK